MAIEPLGSMMSLQAQPSKTQTSQTTKPEITDREVQAPGQIQNVDSTTASVKNVDNKQDDGADSGTALLEQQQQATNEKIKKAVERFNKNAGNSEAVFGIHEATNRVTIKIIDRDTKEVIKELPPEKTLDMIAKVWEMAGILVDEKR